MNIGILGLLSTTKNIYIYYRVVWGEDKLNTISNDVIIVLHCGLWSGLKCAYEAGSLGQNREVEVLSI